MENTMLKKYAIANRYGYGKDYYAITSPYEWGFNAGGAAPAFSGVFTLKRNRVVTKTKQGIFRDYQVSKNEQFQCGIPLFLEADNGGYHELLTEIKIHDISAYEYNIANINGISCVIDFTHNGSEMANILKEYSQTELDTYVAYVKQLDCCAKQWYDNYHEKLAEIECMNKKAEDWIDSIKKNLSE